MNQLLAKAGIRKSTLKWKTKQDVKDLTSLFQTLKTEEAKKIEMKVKALFMACRFDKPEIVDELLKAHDLDVNSCDEVGRTALFYAGESHSSECVNVLLHYGADVNHLDDVGRSVLTTSVSAENYNLAEKLLTKCSLSEAIISETLEYLVRTNNSEGLAIFAEFENVDLHCIAGRVSFLDKKQYSPLHYASKRGFARAIAKLIEAGSRLTFRNNVKDYPANIAYKAKMPKSYMALLAHGSGLSVASDLKVFQNKPRWHAYIERTSTKDNFFSGEKLDNLIVLLETSVVGGDFSGVSLILECYSYSMSKQLERALGECVTQMICYRCTFTRMPALRAATVVSLTECKVSDWSGLVECTNLSHLTLCKMGLDALPNEIMNMKQLRFLGVSHNKALKALPTWISYLNLEYLSVHENHLNKLPPVLPKSLVVLRCHKNQILLLSPTLATLPRLKHIAASGNPLVFPEISIVKNETDVLLQYLASFLEDTVPNTTIKVSLVGREGDGKTSLVEALKSPTGTCDEDFLPQKTDGLEISTISLDGVQLRVFDLAGDIDFIETHTMFISEGTLFLAVFNLARYLFRSESSSFFGRVEIWLNSIFAQVPNSCAILVGTHADSDIMTPDMLAQAWQNVWAVLDRARANHKKYFHAINMPLCFLCSPENVVRQTTSGVAGFVCLDDNGEMPLESDAPISEHEDLANVDREFCFPHIVGYYEVSTRKCVPRKRLSSENLSMEQLKRGIYNICTKLLKMNPVIPRKWLNLFSALQTQVDEQYPVLPYEKFAEIAVQCGLRDEPDDLAPFLRHYHSRGELLFYIDVEDLSDVIIVNPQWLSNQLRAIVSYKRNTFITDGCFRHEHLPKVWPYLEVADQQKLFALFRQAGIFVPFNDMIDLVPCRLPIGRPSDDAWSPLPLPDENQVDYSIEFNSLPPAFFSYLIASVEACRRDFVAKFPPVYTSNHIVFLTKALNFLCNNHSANGISGPLLGSNLMRMMYLDPGSVNCLLNVGDGNSKFSSDEDDDDGSKVSPMSRRKDFSWLRHRVHFELCIQRQAITMSIRGLQPCCLVPETLERVNRVRISRFDGVMSTCRILCPICVRKLDVNPASFALEEVQSQDPICAKGHDCGSWADLMTGHCSYRPELTASKIIRDLNDNEAPKLFVLLPVNLQNVGLKDFYVLSYLKEGFAVHLLCEYPNCWHYLPAAGYRLSRPKEFVATYGRRLQTVMKVLSMLEGPLRVAGSAFGPLSSAADAMQRMGGLSVKLGEFLEDLLGDSGLLSAPEWESVEQSVSYLMSAEGLQRRELCRFLNKADEEGRFGALIPTYVGNSLLWLCEEHHKLEKSHVSKQPVAIQ